jgi:uncharacterized membrane protein
MESVLFIIAFLVFFIVDLLWLGLFAKTIYQSLLKPLLAPKTNWIAAVVFYVLYIVFLVVFVIHPAVLKADILYALQYGAMFGFITYATYDLTNLATLKGWPFKIVWIDMLWGTVLGASVSTITYFIYTGLFL